MTNDDEEAPCITVEITQFGVFAEDLNNNIMFPHQLQLNCFTLSICIKRVEIISNLWLKDGLAVIFVAATITSKPDKWVEDNSWKHLCHFLLHHVVSLFVKGSLCLKMSKKYIWIASDQFQCQVDVKVIIKGQIDSLHQLWFLSSFSKM